MGAVFSSDEEEEEHRENDGSKEVAHRDVKLKGN